MAPNTCNHMSSVTVYHASGQGMAKINVVYYQLVEKVLCKKSQVKFPFVYRSHWNHVL